MANIKYLYISDINNNRIVKIRADNFVYARDSINTGPHAIAFNNVRSLACDSAYLYATDPVMGRISQINLTDLYFRTEGYPPSEIAGMSGALLAYGNILYVASSRQFSYVVGTTTIFTSQGVIRKYSLPDMAFISQTDAPPGTPYGGSGIDKMATDGTYLYATSTDARTVWKLLLSDFSLVGHCEGKPPGWPSLINGYSSGELYPSGIATDGTYLYVTDVPQGRNFRGDYNHLVKLRCSDLSFVTIVGHVRGTFYNQLNNTWYETESLNTETLYNPQDVAYDGGFVYMLDSFNARIQKRNASDLSFVSQTGSYGRRGMPSFDVVKGVNVYYYPFALAIGSAEEEITVVKEWNCLWEITGVTKLWTFTWAIVNATPVTKQWNYLWKVTPVNKQWTINWLIEMLRVPKEWNYLWEVTSLTKTWITSWVVLGYVSRVVSYSYSVFVADTGGGIVPDPVEDYAIALNAFLVDKKKIKLNWTFRSNANFEIFWKSNVPSGQEFVLLATTSAFEYTTADLESTKIYQFYVRGWVGEQFFVSNAVELFVSCGKGVVLTGGNTDEPPCQLAVLGNKRFADMTGLIGGPTNVTQDPTDKDSFYYLEGFNPGDGTKDYRLWKFTWPDTNVLITTITDTGNIYQNLVASQIPAIAYSPNTGAYHICFFFSVMGEYYYDSCLIDVNLSTLAISKNTNQITGIGEYLHWDTCEISHFLDGTHLYFCVAGSIWGGSFQQYHAMMKKEAGNSTAYYHQIANSNGSGIIGPLPGTGRYLTWGSDWYDLNFVTMADTPHTGLNPPYPYYAYGGAPMNKVVIGNDVYRCGGDQGGSPPAIYFYRWNPTESENDSIELVNNHEGYTPIGGMDIIQRAGKSYMLMAHYYSDYKNKIQVSRLIKSPSLVIYNTRSIAVPDNGINTRLLNVWFNYPYIYAFYGSGDNGLSICKICNGVG